MILSSTIATLGAVDYFAGNAKIYDGSFDYDIFNPSIQIMPFGQPITVCWSLYPQVENFTLLDSQETFVGARNGFSMGFVTPSQPFVRLNAVSGNQFLVRSVESVALNTKSVVLITYNGNGIASNIKLFAGGAKLTNNITLDQTPNSISFNNEPFTIGARGRLIDNLFQGYLKRYEVINRVVTDAEALTVMEEGSLRSVEKNRANFLIDLDLNKADGNAPTFFADSPQYGTITSFGGATYIDYPSV